MNVLSGWWKRASYRDDLGGIVVTQQQLMAYLLFVMMSSALLLCTTSGRAQDELEIAGPVEAFEGDVITFTITLDGEPVQARVIFGDDPAVSTNASTGTITFIMPSVPPEGTKYLITASVPGGLTASHSIIVKDTTQELDLDISPTLITETEDFMVTVSDGGTPIENVSIRFNSGTSTTNAQGVVTLTAPDVLVTTNYGIIASKQGYAQASTMVTIQEASRGIQLMEIVAPSIVDPADETMDVWVLGLTGGIEHVLIESYYEGLLIGDYTTDAEGYAEIVLPSLNDEYYFALYVSAEGYQTYDAQSEWLVSLSERDLSSDLVVLWTLQR